MIQRYAMQHGHAASQPCECGPAENIIGYFCTYEDHAALVEKLVQALESILDTGGEDFAGLKMECYCGYVQGADGDLDEKAQCEVCKARAAIAAAKEAQ